MKEITIDENPDDKKAQLNYVYIIEGNIFKLTYREVQ